MGKEEINREEIKNKLISLGIDPELLKIPVIFESCLDEYLDRGWFGQPLDIYSSRKFSVICNDDGSYRVGKIDRDGEWVRYIEFPPNGQSLKGHIDFSDFHYKLVYDFDFAITKEGFMGPGNVICDDTSNYDILELLSSDIMASGRPDLGFISFSDYFRNLIHLQSAGLSMDEIMEKYDKHHRDVVEHYPELDEYYKSKRLPVARSTIKYLLFNKSQSVVSKEDIEQYFEGTEAEFAIQLLEMNKNHEKDVKLIKRLQGMLGKTLAFVGKVKQIPFMGFLFGKQIKEIEEAGKEEEIGENES